MELAINVVASILPWDLIFQAQIPVFLALPFPSSKVISFCFLLFSFVFAQSECKVRVYWLLPYRVITPLFGQGCEVRNKSGP